MGRKGGPGRACLKYAIGRARPGEEFRRSDEPGRFGPEKKCKCDGPGRSGPRSWKFDSPGRSGVCGMWALYGPLCRTHESAQGLSQVGPGRGP